MPSRSLAKQAFAPPAFSGRDAGHTININATTATAAGFDEEREWSRSFWTALRPYHSSVYVNFLMDEGEERIRQAYGPERYDRLKALKRKYDPDNFFRLNQNIPPGEITPEPGARTALRPASSS